MNFTELIVCELISCYWASHVIQLCSQSLVRVSNTGKLIHQKCGSDQSKTAFFPDDSDHFNLQEAHLLFVLGVEGPTPWLVSQASPIPFRSADRVQYRHAEEGSHHFSWIYGNLNRANEIAEHIIGADFVT